jgi:hypothetical protein
MEERESNMKEHRGAVLTDVREGLTHLLHLVAYSNMLLLVRLSSTQLAWLYAERGRNRERPLWGRGAGTRESWRRAESSGS